MSKNKKKKNETSSKHTHETNPIHIIAEEEVKLNQGDSIIHHINTVDERPKLKKIITSK